MDISMIPGNSFQHLLQHLRPLLHLCRLLRLHPLHQLPPRPERRPGLAPRHILARRRRGEESPSDLLLLSTQQARNLSPFWASQQRRVLFKAPEAGLSGEVTSICLLLSAPARRTEHTQKNESVLAAKMDWRRTTGMDVACRPLLTHVCACDGVRIIQSRFERHGP